MRTCDNHCEFCFIHQLPKGLRRSLYVRDDDYRLSFLYGNFTTLTRFTEADLERVVTEGLSPLWVSIHATDPEVRSRMLRNRRGATSLRWLRALLDHGIEVHGQVVVCPDVNDGPVLEDTLAGVLDRYPELASVACVPLGVSRFNVEAGMRPHTPAEADQVVDLVEDWQQTFLRARRPASGVRLGRVLPDERAVLSRPWTPTATWPSTTTESACRGRSKPVSTASDDAPAGGPGGFFQSVDGAPAAGYRAPRNPGSVTLAPRPDRPGDGPHRHLRGPGDSPSRRLGPARCRGAARGQQLFRREHRRGRAADRQPTWPKCSTGRRSGAATCCRTSACPAGGSSTGWGSGTCPGR